jgi:hypothetical protein
VPVPRQAVNLLAVLRGHRRAAVAAGIEIWTRVRHRGDQTATTMSSAGGICSISVTATIDSLPGQTIVRRLKLLARATFTSTPAGYPAGRHLLNAQGLWTALGVGAVGGLPGVEPGSALPDHSR